MQINVESVESEEELQEVLARHLRFPDFYGKNWDAFWDAITGLVELPNQLEFIGTAQLQAVIPDAHQKLTESLVELNQEFPELGVEVIWNYEAVPKPCTRTVFPLGLRLYYKTTCACGASRHAHCRFNRVTYSY